MKKSGKDDSRWMTRWWVLEGPTHVDCYIETPRIRLFIEGKRTDRLSPGTSWYKKRNQLLRSLESASCHRNGKDFAQLLITEQPEPLMTADVVTSSLPHLAADEMAELLRHYAGSVTWMDICSAVSLKHELLPDTIVKS